MQDLWRLSAAEMAALIRAKKVSAKEAATAALARLDAVNPKINAVVDHRPADVLAQASAVLPLVSTSSTRMMLLSLMSKPTSDFCTTGFGKPRGVFRLTAANWYKVLAEPGVDESALRALLPHLRERAMVTAWPQPVPPSAVSR